MWSFFRRKLGIEEQDRRIYRNSREIKEIKRRVSEKKKETEQQKVVKKVISRDHRVGKVQEELRSLVNWAKDVSKSFKNDKKAINELTYMIEENLDALSNIDSIEEVRDQNKSLEKKIDRISEKVEELSEGIPRTSQGVINKSRRVAGRSEDTETLQNKRDTEIDQTARQIKEGKKLWKKATDAHRQIIRRMYDLGYPVTYRELSSDLEKSISTVKNQINDLKTMGFDFKEEIGPNNTKRYLLDDRVKTFLTLRLND